MTQNRPGGATRQDSVRAGLDRVNISLDSLRPERYREITRGGEISKVMKGIEAANPGDTIMVAPGTYHENIRLSKAVSLVAATFDEGNAANDLSILDGGNGEATVRIPKGVTPMPVVQGFVIRNSKEGIQARSPLTVENNFFYGSQTAVEYAIGAGGINRNNLYFNSRGDAVHVDRRRNQNCGRRRRGGDRRDHGRQQ